MVDLLFLDSKSLACIISVISEAGNTLKPSNLISSQGHSHRLNNPYLKPASKCLQSVKEAFQVRKNPSTSP